MPHFKSAGAAVVFGLLVAGLVPLSLAADGFAPYGVARSREQGTRPLKYVVESSSLEPAEVANTLRVAGQILSLSPKGSEMAVVVIGPGIRVFATENYEKYQAIVQRAADLRDAGVQILYCGSSMKGAGFSPADLHGLGEVVAGGYVEIAELVSRGYVHVRPPADLQRTGGARYLDHPEQKK